MKRYTDLPTDAETIDEEAAMFLDELEELANDDSPEGDDMPKADIILIAAAQDPLELTLGEPDENGVQKREPRWSPLQQKIIVAAQDLAGRWAS